MKTILMILLCIAAIDTFSQNNATINEKSETLTTYPFSDPNPIPEFRTIYPYFTFEDFSEKGINKEWKMVEMENDYIKLWITPDIGGKIWGAIEKTTGNEFVYFNHAVKFRDIAMRGPWTSGGIEINFGVIGHAPTCSTPVDYYNRTNDDGSVSCFVGAIDLASRTRWSVEINLPEDKAYFTTRLVWDNPTSLEQSYYHWMNLGVKTAGDLEYIFPGAYHLGHNGRYSSWPIDDQGHKINFYENNNFGGSKSYHIIGEISDFFATYWHEDDFGFAHYSLYDEKPGKKIWIWGLSDQGMIWEKLLTDTDGQYTEIQSGRLFNQAGKESTYTPFKHRGFLPGATDEWTEYWFPVKETGGLKAAVPEGSVNLQQKDNIYHISFCPNEKTDGKLEVKAEGKVIFTKEFHFVPMETVSESFEYEGYIEELSVRLNNKLLYSADHKDYRIKRPVESPSCFSWHTAYGHYLKGKEEERQRQYKLAEEAYRRVLVIEPYFIPALTGMANLAYRKTDYESSLDYSLKALSIDTYDPEANMIYGLASLALGDTASAIDGFSIATASVSHKVPAYNALSTIFLNKGDFSKALVYAEKSLIYNQLGGEAIQQKILSCRKTGMNEEAFSQMEELEKRDPLNHFIWFEKYLINPSSENKNQIKKYITNEFPHETYLEYALWYFRNGQQQDALKILELSSQDQPVVLLWEAYLNHLSGKEKLAAELLNSALLESPELVFPFRIETLKPLEWAQTLSDDWKVKYYTGLIYLNAGASEKGKNLWKSCNNNPDFYPFYIARSMLLGEEDPQSEADMERALTLGSNKWRAGLFASKYYLKTGNLQKAEELARTNYKMNPGNYTLGLHFAKVLERNKKYQECVQLLQKINVLPNEGATEGRIIWRYANIGAALDNMKEKKYRKAITSINLAKQWPVNLGVGKPYSVDERLEDFIALQCFKKLKETESVQLMQNKIITYAAENNYALNINDFLTAWILKKTGKQAEGDQIMDGLSEKFPSSNSIQWCKAIYYDELKTAEKLLPKIDKEEYSFSFISRIFNEFVLEE